MMKNPHRPTLETIFFSLAVLLALGFRFYNLGAAPLNEAEASWALQALHIARPGMTGEPFTIGPNPGYVMLTGILFAIFSANNFLARFWPALAGTLLVLSPLFFRRELGRATALLLAFGLAATPGLVVVSRQAGGPMMALGFGLLAIGLWRARQALWAGLFAGLALLSGPYVLQGMLALGLTWAATRLFRRRSKEDNQPAKAGDPGEVPDSMGTSMGVRDMRLALASAATTVLLVGTLFLQYPQGLSAWFSELPAYLQGWAMPSGTPALKLIAGLLVYQPFAALFALVGLGRWLVRQSLGNKDTSVWYTTVLLWAIFSLGLVLFYPARQVPDLVWALVPIWTLTAIELENYLPAGKLRPLSLAQAGLLFLLAALFWNTLIATEQVAPPAGLPWVGVRSAILLGILSLGALTTVLVALGWSWEVSRDGLILGLTAALAVYGLAAMWGAAQLRPNNPSELWHASPGTGNTDLFLATLGDLSNWETGFPHTIDIVSSVDDPSLRWALRDYTKVRYVTAPPSGELPGIVVTRPAQDVPALTASYRGQDFAWWVQADWEGVLPPNPIGWLTFRQAPVVNEQIILWARSDIFPGGALNMESEAEPGQ